MKLVLLYPRAWRKRYGDEFEALMADAPARNFDVLKGALAMRWKYLPGWAMLLGFATLGLLAGLASSYLFEQKWESAAVLRLSPQGVAASTAGAQQAYDLAAAQNEIVRHIQAATGPDIPIVPTPWPLLTPGYIPTLLFVVRSRNSDPVRAKAAVEAAIPRIVRMDHPGHDVDVLDKPRLPRGPVFPNRPLFGAVGLATGMILATAGVLVRRLIPPPGMHTA